MPPDDPLRYKFDGHSRNNDKFTVGTFQGRLWLKSFSAQWYLNSRDKTVPNGVATTQLGVDKTYYKDTRGFLELSLSPRFGDKLATLTRASVNLYQFRDRLWYYPPFIGSGLYEAADREKFDDIWLLAEQRVEFETAVTESAQSVTVDPEALRQIFTNLFDNALRHTSPGGRVRVLAAPAGDDVIVRVSDTGTGIAAEHLARIFERFYRVDPGRSRQEGGTGLGLAIVKHLVEAQGGSVSAESELGRGTTILLTFPAVTQS